MWFQLSMFTVARPARPERPAGFEDIKEHYRVDPVQRITACNCFGSQLGI